MNNLETKNTLQGAADRIEEIRNDVNSGKITDRQKAAEETAMELFKGIEAMFKENPVRAAVSITKTYKDAFIQGLSIGLVVGAFCAFVIAYFIN